MSEMRTSRSSLARFTPVAVASVLLALLAVGSGVRPRPATGAPATPPQENGQALYGQFCAVCHQASGAGLAPVFPPLAGSEWVSGDSSRIVKIVLHGLSGPVEVKGTTYNSMMPGWGATMNDAQVAAVATYVRASFGNKAGPVTTAQVAAIRAATSSRKTPWTAAELAAAAK